MTFWRGSAEWRKAEQLDAAGDRAGAAGHLRLARDAFRRCRDIRYRPDATSFNLSKVEERLAQLE